MKTDLYTKIVLTVIAVFLGILIVKDIDLVSKAQASPANIDLSALNIEKAENSDENEMTFFIYENDKIEQPFTKGKYYYDGNVCRINCSDVPSFIITNVKPKQSYPYYTEIKRTK